MLSAFQAIYTISLIAILYTSSATASTPTCRTVTENTRLNMPDMSIRHDAAIGSIIGTAVATRPISTFACSTGFTWQEFYVKGRGVPSSKVNGLNIYRLGPDDSGIGYAVYGESTGVCQGWKPVIGDSPVGGVDVRLMCLANGTFPGQPLTGALRLAFFKKGISPPNRSESKSLVVLH